MQLGTVHTFGCPRTFDPVAALHWRLAGHDSFRFVHNNDEIARLPRRRMLLAADNYALYEHVGRFYLLGALRGRLFPEPSTARVWWEGIKGGISDSGSAGLDTLKDHGIAQYLRSLRKVSRVSALAAGVDIQRVTLMAELCAAAFRNGPTAAGHALRIGFEDAVLIDEGSGAECLVARRDDGFVIAVWRGSDSAIVDVEVDQVSWAKDAGSWSGLAHRGFHDGVLSIETRVLEALETFTEGGRLPVHCGGHSKGGGECLVFAARMRHGVRAKAPAANA